VSHRTKSLLVGVLAGALLGAAFAWAATDNDDEQDPEAGAAIATLGPADYFTLGISILTLARQFSGMLRKA